MKVLREKFNKYSSIVRATYVVSLFVFISVIFGEHSVATAQSVSPITIQYIKGEVYQWAETKDANNVISLHFTKPYNHKLVGNEADKFLALSSEWKNNPLYKGRISDETTLSDIVATAVDEIPLIEANHNQKIANSAINSFSKEKVNPDLFPNNTVSYVQGYFGSQVSRATAFFISPFVALTNSHLVVKSNGDIADRINVYMGLERINGSPSFNKMYKASSFVYDPVYAFGAKRSNGSNWTWDMAIHDVSAIFVDSGSDFSNFVFIPIVIGYANVGTTVVTSGYPASFNNASSNFDQAKITYQITSSQQDGKLYETFGDPGLGAGASGSPTWVDLGNNDLRVVGIHNRGSSTGFGGVRFNDYNENLLLSFISYNPTNKDNVAPELSSVSVQQNGNKYVVDFSVADSDLYGITYSQTKGNQYNYLFRDQRSLSVNKSNGNTLTIQLWDAFHNTSEFTIDLINGRIEGQEPEPEPIVKTNNAPTVTKTLEAVSFVFGDTERMIADLNNVFNDEDGDNLIFTATSNAYVEASIRGSELWLKANKVTSNSTSLVITAADPEGENVSTSIVVDVQNIPNSRPIALLSDTTLTFTINDASIELNILDPLSEFFEDEENDELTFSLTGADASLFKIEEEALILVNASLIPTTTITVSVIANDTELNSETINISVELVREDQPQFAAPIRIVSAITILNHTNSNNTLSLGELKHFFTATEEAPLSIHLVNQNTELKAVVSKSTLKLEGINTESPQADNKVGLFASHGEVNSDTLWITYLTLSNANNTNSQTDNSLALENDVPAKISLSQNYPNPFNPSTTISFNVAQSGKVQLNVYNMNGQLVQQLVDGQLAAGQHSSIFNATNLPSGVYLYRLVTPSQTITKKMTLLK